MIVLRLGVLYFAIVFALGFVLGVARVLLQVPRLGETAAVALELPLMLAASWFICALLLRRRALAVPSAWAMGAIAFVCLMLAEAALGVGLAGRSLPEHLARYLSAAGALGLAGQLAFAALPALQTILQQRQRRADGSQRHA